MDFVVSDAASRPQGGMRVLAGPRENWKDYRHLKKCLGRSFQMLAR